MGQKFNLDEYEPVHERIKKFYAACPDGRIITNVETLSDDDVDTVLCRAAVYRNAEEQEKNLPLATGWASETKGDGYVNKTSHVENGETSAIGRALANCYLMLAGDKRPSREEMDKVNRGDNAPTPDSMKKEITEKIEDAEVIDAFKSMKLSVQTVHDICTRNKWNVEDIKAELVKRKFDGTEVK